MKTFKDPLVTNLLILSGIALITIYSFAYNLDPETNKAVSILRPPIDLTDYSYIQFKQSDIYCLGNPSWLYFTDTLGKEPITVKVCK